MMSLEEKLKYEDMFNFEYKGKKYCLAELIVPQSNMYYDIIVILEKVKRYIDDDIFDDYKFIEYFYGADDSVDKLIENAKYYIDNPIKKEYVEERNGING